jgi:hypothetical protein
MGWGIGSRFGSAEHDILLEDWKCYVDFADRVMPAK